MTARKVQFRGIRDGRMTRHLLVYNVGLNTNINETMLQIALNQVGNVHVESVEMSTIDSSAFVTLASNEEAMRIICANTRGEIYLPRKLHIILAERACRNNDSMVDLPPSIVIDDAVEKRLYDLSEHVEGLYICYDFVSIDEEQHLLKSIDANELWASAQGYAPAESNASKMKRRVQHFGFRFDYHKRSVDESNKQQPIPSYCADIMQRVTTLLEKDVVFDQLTINEYRKGQGIRMHTDVHSSFDEPVVSLSLGCAAVMQFENPITSTRVGIALLPRSIVVLSGAARYLWTHSIAPRKFDRIGTKISRRGTRVSMTFRQVRRSGVCNCDWPISCDSQQSEPPANDDLKEQPRINLQRPLEVEKAYVSTFYDTIADHFSSTRTKPWPQVDRFVRELQDGGLLVDIGCGNGRYIGSVPRSCTMIGIDQCARLLELARERVPNCTVARGDIMRIPLRSNCADAVVCIAVLHHIASHSRRVDAIRELVRIARPGAHLLVTAWALEQDENSKRHFTDADCFVPWRLPPKFAKHESPRGMNCHRYCHVFRQHELPSLLKDACGYEMILEKQFYDQSNWCIVFRKHV